MVAGNMVAARKLATALGGLMLIWPALAVAAAAAECPGNPDALGTSRTLVVDPTEHPKLGSMQYHESLPLEDHEIVITFDDGPLPPRSTAVLDTLDRECVKATFFLIGKMARAYPDTVKRIRDAGHTIGTHSNSHPLTFHRMPVDRAAQEINQGIANVTAALGDGTGPAPFFRIPGLLRAEGVEHYAASQNLQVWSADFLADDWTKIGPSQVYSRALQRIEAAHKGILLLHDIQTKTVEALPYLLRELKRRGYKIVQVVPATPERPKTMTEPAQWMAHARQISRTHIFMESEPELPVPNPASFGFDVGSNAVSFLQKISLARDTAWQPLVPPAPGPVTPVSMWPSGFEVTQASSSGRFQFPALGPRVLDFDDSLKAWASRTPVDAETRGAVAVNEIQRLLESLPEENGPPVEIHNKKISGLLDGASGEEAATGLPALHPLVNAVIPRGAFP
jgi:peptidoglycan/xylan/chitin deacetylase (PgdA/CDA1 family)